MASKPPAFQFYANDFMDATCSWEANAVGLYIRCLCKQWTHGGLPNDLKVLARMIHCDRSELEGVWDVLQTKLPEGADGLLRNSRLEEIRERQSEISLKRSEAGRSGVLAKAIASANGQAKTKQRKVKEKVKENTEEEASFEHLWKIFERYGARKKASDYWARLSEEDRSAVIAKAPEYVRSTPGCEYRKQLEGWINPDNRLWERPIVVKQTAPKPDGPITNREYQAGLAKARADLGIEPGGLILTEQIPEHLRKAKVID